MPPGCSKYTSRSRPIRGLRSAWLLRSPSRASSRRSCLGAAARSGGLSCGAGSPGARRLFAVWLPAHSLFNRQSGSPIRGNNAYTPLYYLFVSAGLRLAACLVIPAVRSTPGGIGCRQRRWPKGGRRPKLTPQQQSEIRQMVTRGDKTAASCHVFCKLTLDTEKPFSFQAYHSDEHLLD